MEDVVGPVVMMTARGYIFLKSFIVVVKNCLALYCYAIPARISCKHIIVYVSGEPHSRIQMQHW